MKWSDEQIEKLKALCFSGESNVSLAKQFGVNINEIHAKRSQLGITIPKIAAMKGKSAITVDPDFETAVVDMEKSLHRSLPSGVREAFNRLQDELLLAMARNGTSLEDAKRYGATADIVSLAQDSLKCWLGRVE